MKKISSLKKITSLVLAVIMVLSVSMSYIGPVKAADGGATDDFGRWFWTNGNTVTAGNWLDGWGLELKSGYASWDKYAGYFLSYRISDLKIQMNVSEMEIGEEIFLQFANNTINTPTTWTDYKLFLRIKKTSDTVFTLEGVTSNQAAGIQEVSVTDAILVFEFLQDANQAWQPALNGTMIDVGTTLGKSANQIVNGFDTVNAATVGFGSNGSTDNPVKITNVKFLSKNQSGIADDISSWYTKYQGSVINGNATDGWRLALAGTNSGLAQSYENNIAYKSSYQASDILATMDLSMMKDGQEFFVQCGSSVNGVAGGWSNQKIYFSLKRSGDNLIFCGYKNASTTVGSVTIPLDFSTVHTFEFKKDAGNQWQPAIDGTTYSMGDGIDGTTVDAFVENMLASNTPVWMSFIQVKDTVRNSLNNQVIIQNVKFYDKKVVGSDLTGWTVGTSNAITGTPTAGWKVALAGGSISTVGTYAAYQTAYQTSELQVTMDLSTMTDTQSFWYQLGNQTGNYAQNWKWDGTRLTYQLKKNGTTLEIYGHNGSAQTTTCKITDFGFTTPHTFGLVKDTNGKWQFGVDGNVCSMEWTEADVTAGKADANSTVDYFVAHMENKLTADVVVSFCGSGVTINNVQFSCASDLQGWTSDANNKMIGTPADGWKVALANGNISTVGTYAAYATSYKAHELQVTMDLSTMVDKQSFWFQTAFKTYGYNEWTWNTARLTFNIQRDGTTLKVYGHNSKAQTETVVVQNFDYNTPHVFEFLKDANGKWQLGIDGSLCLMEWKAEDVAAGKVSETSTVDGFINYMGNAANVVVSFCRNSSTAVIINNVQFSKKPAPSDDATGWTQGTSNTITGNAIDGWNVALSGGGVLDTATYASFTSDYRAADIRLTMDLSTLGTSSLYLQMGNKAYAYGSWQWNGAKIVFEMKKLGNELYICGYDQTNTTIGAKTTTGIDFNVPHTFEFLQDKYGHWQLAIDGELYPMEVEGSETINANYFVNHMAKVGNVTVSFCSGNNAIKNIKIAPKMNAKGATVATAFEDSVPIKMGFDFSVMKSYLSQHETIAREETLVNYGAVLVSKAYPAALMQRALINTLKEGDVLDTSKVHYSEDYTYMITAGKNEELPKSYSVTVKRTDDEAYRERSVSAIGYVVTTDAEGNYRYYFTSNVNTDKNIVAGVVSKSVTNVLKAVCQEYVNVYNDDGISEASKVKLIDVIGINFPGYVGLEVTSLENAVNGTLTDYDLLKTVHLGMYKETLICKINNYGAVANGTTDNSEALADALQAVKEKVDEDKKVELQFEAGDYYFKDMKGNSAIFDLKNYKNLTITGSKTGETVETTLILDKTNKLVHWFNIESSQNVIVQNFNLDLSQKMYTLAEVVGQHAYYTSGWGVHDYDDKLYIDIQTEEDFGLGIGETFTPGYSDGTSSVAFGLPYAVDENGQFVNRSHLYILKIDRLDNASSGEYKYRVYIARDDNFAYKVKYMVENDLPFMIGVPGWGRYGEADGSGAIVVTNSTNMTLQNINVWSSPTFVFHMRNNYGTFNIKNCDVTTKEADGELAAWVDIFHLKENRCKFIIEDCLLEKAQDDVFNVSVTNLSVSEKISGTEFKLECEQLGGYWMELQEGDTITLLNEETGEFIGRTKITKVVSQENGIPHIQVADELSGLEVGVDAYIDSLGQPNSIIRNCTITGTYRFRTPITIENCTLNTIYGFIDTYPGGEGPIPRDITFKDCIFRSVKPTQEQKAKGYISVFSDTYMMQVGVLPISNSNNCKTENIVFENCKYSDGRDMDSTLIDCLNNTGVITIRKR